MKNGWKEGQEWKKNPRQRRKNATLGNATVYPFLYFSTVSKEFLPAQQERKKNTSPKVGKLCN